MRFAQEAPGCTWAGEAAQMAAVRVAMVEKGSGATATEELVAMAEMGAGATATEELATMAETGAEATAEETAMVVSQRRRWAGWEQVGSKGSEAPVGILRTMELVDMHRRLEPGNGPPNVTTHLPCLRRNESSSKCHRRRVR